MSQLKPLVIGVSQDLQIDQAVVEGVAVDVVDVLMRGQLPSKVLLHDIAMLSDLPPVHTDRLVPMSGFGALRETKAEIRREMNLGQAIPGAVLSSPGPVAPYVEALAASHASEHNPALGAPVKRSGGSAEAAQRAVLGASSSRSEALATTATGHRLHAKSVHQWR